MHLKKQWSIRESLNEAAFAVTIDSMNESVQVRVGMNEFIRERFVINLAGYHLELVVYLKLVDLHGRVVVGVGVLCCVLDLCAVSF